MLATQAYSQGAFQNFRKSKSHYTPPSTSSAKTTATSERVIGTKSLSFFGGMYQNNDSSRLTYSNGRGHDAAYEEIKFDELNYLEWDAATQTWGTSSIERQTFDGANNVITFTEENDFITGSLEPYSKDFYTYDANGNRTVSITQYWDATLNAYVNDSKDSMAFNTNGHQIHQSVLRMEFW